MGLRCLPTLSLSLKVSSSIVAVIELIAAAVIGTLCALHWKMLTSKQGVSYIYQEKSGDSPDVRNGKILACVTFWLLTLISAMAFLHFILASLVLNAIKKKSESLARAFIVLKGLAFIFSIFFSIASMTTAGYWTKGVALADFGFHLITLYYIKVMYEAMADFANALISKKSVEAF